MKAVCLTWLDSCTDAQWDHSPQPSLARIQSLGWVIEQTDTIITIAQSIDADGGSADRLTVPIVSITEMKFIQ